MCIRDRSVLSRQSMGEGVHESVHSDPVRVTRELVRILGQVHVLVRITEVRIVVDYHHQSSGLVPDTFAFCGESVLFVRDEQSFASIGETRNLLQVVDIEELMKKRMADW